MAIAQRGDEYPISASVQGQIGLDFEQPGLVKVFLLIAQGVD